MKMPISESVTKETSPRVRPGTGLLEGALARACEPVGIRFLIQLRILLGLVLAYEVWLFFEHNLITRYFVEQKTHFTYLWFDWLPVLSPQAMHFHFIVLGILALMVLIGFAYRLAISLFCFGFTYVFLLEKARYMNHFYLIILLCAVLAFMPAHAAWSADAVLRPSVRRRWCPAWMLWILRLQLGVVYFYAGLAKVTPDWLSGRVLGEMLEYKQHLPLVSWIVETPSMVLAASWLAMLFDILIVPLLLWKRTRIAAFVMMAIFHACNTVLFKIDVFPVLMAGATLILFLPQPADLRDTTDRDASDLKTSKFALTMGGAYALLQVLIPLRHLAYPGDAAWTDEGQTFAWRMLMRVKTGTVPRFPVRYSLDGTVYEAEVPIPQDPDFWAHHWQARKMLIDPDLILQFVHQQAEKLKAQGAEDLDIRAIVPVSLNGRPPQLLIDPDVNLANEVRSLRPKKWITTVRQSAQNGEGGSSPNP
ncbi:HTTM domain-containing protein [Fuerstiella marisgermanici]|nr:HTTM domain-containing protein [Fuerstiella marisgermanici]